MVEHEPCPQFGWGFSDDHEMCQYCTKILECIENTTREHIAKQSGHNPKIPYATEPKRLQIYFEKPKVVGDQVIFSFKIEADWLRKKLGWGRYGNTQP